MQGYASRFTAPILRPTAFLPRSHASSLQRLCTRQLATSSATCKSSHPTPSEFDLQAQPSTTILHNEDIVQHKHKHSHGEEYNEPTGYLFGMKPGTNRKFYWWEPIWYFGFYGGILVFLVAEWYSPKKSVRAYTTEEAHRRLAERGETFAYPLPAEFSPYSKRYAQDEDTAKAV